jgi:hypothetical protein
MTLRHFKLPGGTDFAIPVDWWDAAGMEEFRCTSESYYFVHSPEITLIAINQFVPPPLSGRPHLDHNGFDRCTMVWVLQGIAANSTIDPVEISAKPRGAYRWLTRGYHRFYASAAAGFSHIPTVLGWIPDPET